MTTMDLSPAAAAVLTPAAWAAMNRTPVLLGWPVLQDCTAPRHNTLGAARLAGDRKCRCPHAVALRRAHSEKDKQARKAKREALTPEQRAAALQARRDREAATAKLREDAVYAAQEREVAIKAELPTDTQPVQQSGAQACLLRAFGGRLEVHQVDDFWDETSGASGQAARERAKAICRTCPVQRDCLTQAVDRGEAFGIWGGLDPQERRSPRHVAAELRAIPVYEEAA